MTCTTADDYIRCLPGPHSPGSTDSKVATHTPGLVLSRRLADLVVESGHMLVVRSCMASSPSFATTANGHSNEVSAKGRSSPPLSSSPDDEDLGGSGVLASDTIDRVLAVVASGGRTYSRREALYSHGCHVALDLHLWTSSPTSGSHGSMSAPSRLVSHASKPMALDGSGREERAPISSAEKRVPGVFSLGLGGGSGGTSGALGRAKAKE